MERGQPHMDSLLSPDTCILIFPEIVPRYKNDFRESGGLENQSVQELENYAVYKAEETTSTVNNCLKIAEDIREDATRTLDMLHQQGEQIRRTHDMVADQGKGLVVRLRLPTNALQKVEVCDLTSLFHSDSSLLSICSQGFFGRQVEKAKQDDALSDLSNVLSELKSMAVDMGGELDRPNKALNHLSDDVDELNSQVKGANQRTHRLLGK
ncbi:hypothetical protein NL676_032265 [Syzygium grande]|nr:hypothetical protein NL676_032265 [Syzygium grande]